MKFLSLMLSVSMLSGAVIPGNVHARTTSDYEMKVSNTEEKVNAIFDQFNYKMTVEWDQKDAEFKKQAEADLKQNILDLEATGVSLVDIQKTMEKKISTGKFKQDYEQFVDAMKKQNLSEEELNAKTLEFAKKNYQEGVDFLGKGGGASPRWGMISAVIVVVVIAYIIYEKNKDKNDDKDEPIQEEEENCECYEYDDCYYPSYPQ